MKKYRRYILSILVPLLLFQLAAASSCNPSPEKPKSKDIQLAELGREINRGLNETVKALRTAHRGGLLQDAPYAFLLHKAKAIQTAADHANATLDQLSTLDLNNRENVLAALTEITLAVQNATNDPLFTLLSPNVQQQVNRVLSGISIGVQIASTLVSGLTRPTPPKDIRFQFTEVY
jgi:hypothetical protein